MPAGKTLDAGDGKEGREEEWEGWGEKTPRMGMRGVKCPQKC